MKGKSVCVVRWNYCWRYVCSFIMDGSTLIRKLPPGVVSDLIRMLETRDAWKQLMATVPREEHESDDCYVPKYKMEHIK